MTQRASLRALGAVFFAAAAWAAAGGPARAAADMDLVNAIHVRVNGAPVMQQDVQDTANFIVSVQHNGKAPSARADIVALQAESVRQQVRALLIIEEMRRLGVKVDKEDYEDRLKRFKINPGRVSPAVRRLIEAQCVLQEVLRHNGVPPYSPAPADVREFYRRHAMRLFRESGQVRLRRMLFYERPLQSRADLLQEVRGDIARISALPLAERANAATTLATEKSKDLFAAEGGLIAVDPTLDHGWVREEFDYINPQNGMRPVPKEILEPTMALIRAGRPGSFTAPVETDLGVMLVFLEAVRPGKVATFEETRDQIQWIMGETRNNERSRNWMRKKFEQSRIAWNDGEPYTFEELTANYLVGRTEQ